MSEDQNRARLERHLRFAHRVFKEGEKSGRYGMIAAINAAVVFVRSIDVFNRDGLAAPLIAVSAALTDLDEGALHPSLRPETTVGRRPDTMERQALRAASAATMDLAMQAGMSQEAAAIMVARHLQNRGVDVRGDNLNLTWGTVKRWRDELRAGPHEDFAVRCYRELIEELEIGSPAGTDPNTVGQYLLSALDDVLDTFGQI